METFRTKYAYKISLWIVLIPTAIYLLFIPYGYLLSVNGYPSASAFRVLLQYLYATHILAAYVSVVVFILAIFLRFLARKVKENYMDLISLLFSLVPYIFMALTRKDCGGFESCFMDEMTELYIVDSYAIFILLAFIFSIKYIFFKKEEILN
jgi:hypothetical protein